MKEILLSLLLLSSLKSGHSQIPNNSFEFWNTLTGFQYPDGWIIDNDGTLTPGALKDTNAYIGEYALRLSRASMSYVSATCNFPINYHPSQLNLFLRGDQHPKDTLEIKVSLFDLGNIVDSGFLNYTQYETEDYTIVGIDITQNSLTADSAVIEIEFDCHSPLTDVVDFYIDLIYFDDNIGISETEFTTLEIFPSPATDYIIIQNPPEDFEVDEIVATTSIGQSYSLAKTTGEQMDVSSLPSGSYQLIIRSREKKYWGKFLKL